MAGVPSEETSVGGDVFAAPGTGVDETGRPGVDSVHPTPSLLGSS